MPQPPLITTKFSIPPLRQQAVLRPRLSQRLDHALTRPLTLLLAPAGFGKSTILSEWIQQQHQANMPSKRVQFAWLSLDQADSDPHRFGTYLVGALQQIDFLNLSKLLEPPAPPLETTLTEIINMVAAQPHPVVLVLDDYHLIDSETIARGLTFLLENHPPTLHLIIASRVAPNLPLARLRAHGQLLTLTAADLRFTPPEAAAFLKQTMGLNLNATTVTTLENRTEGWIAGLQLAALAMLGSGKAASPDALLTFGGEHRYLVDYLAEEVLNQQPPAVQNFLLSTAILERLTAPLCDAVTGHAASQAMLHRLDQANLFIIPLDEQRQWYRYHHLFRDFLRHRLIQSQPQQRLILHQRAADWCATHHLVAEALAHALEAADINRARRLIEQHALRVVSRSEMTTVLSWLDNLSTELKQSQPRLSLFKAWALLITGQINRVEAQLQAAQEALQTQPPLAADIEGEIASIRGTRAYLNRDTTTAIAHYQTALATLPPQNMFLRGAVALNLGLAYGWEGRIKEATPLLQQAKELNLSLNNDYVTSVALWNLAQLQLEQGRLHQAEDLYQQIAALESHAPAETEAHAPRVHADMSGVYIGRGYLLYQRDDLAAAAENLAQGLALAAQGTDSILITGYITMLQVRAAEGHITAALALARQAEAVIRREQIADYWLQQLRTTQAWLWLQQGNLAAVERWATESNLDFALADATAAQQAYPQEAAYLVLARWLLAQNKADLVAQAGRMLAAFRESMAATGRRGRLLEVLLLQALVRQAQGEEGAALQLLNQALLQAEPEQYVRLFVAEGSPMARLLRRVDRHAATYEYAGRLLDAFGPQALAPEVEPLAEPLSERELEILQLVAAGLSNKKIGETLFLTTGTVKWHVSNIYSKLNVSKRTQAVARARALRLL